MSPNHHYRTVWISDAHLCTRDSQADVLYDFLDKVTCDQLYLVGDIVDIWALQKKWYWPAAYNEVIHKLLKRSRRGARVVFIPGNHDEFFREFAGYNFGNVRVMLNAMHDTADGRRLLVMHGDEFDTVVRHHRWLSRLGGLAYHYLIKLNRLVNAVRRFFGKPYWSFSGAVKRRVKQAVSFVSRFEDLLLAEAKRQGVDGVICGHIHQPALREIDGVLYCNTGDWVEHCTALVELQSGELKLLWWRDEMSARNAIKTTAVATVGSAL